MKEYKRCPRCNKRVYSSQQICPVCLLKFSKLSKANNRIAKEALRMGQPERVVYTRNMPDDVNRVKLMIYALFFGSIGIDRLMVGRYKSGMYLMISSIIGVIMTIVSVLPIADTLSYTTTYILMYGTALWGINIIIGIFSFLNILTKRYKVPVGLNRKGENNE